MPGRAVARGPSIPRLTLGAAAVAAITAGIGVASEVASLAEVDFTGAEVVLLGEVHDNPAHHVGQAEALRRIDPSAVVFEMLTPDQARAANAFTGDSAALGAAIDWDESGWPDFAMYAPVFEALGAARIYGAAVAPDRLREAMTEGLGVAFGGNAARFGLEAPLPATEQAAREARQATAHCDALPAEALPGMVAAQRLRDAAFARTALVALEETGGPVAVITGNGHVRLDWGIPAALRNAAPEVEVLALGQFEAAPGPDAPFDFWRVTAPVERGDPCAAFR